jgi:hypothetical protein
MKRKSLQFKFQEVTKLGTLRSYSKDEAYIFYYNEYKKDRAFRDEMISKANNAYDRGLVLCSFKAFEGSNAGCLNVSQFTKSLASFVLDVCYILVCE